MSKIVLKSKELPNGFFDNIKLKKEENVYLKEKEKEREKRFYTNFYKSTVQLLEKDDKLKKYILSKLKKLDSLSGEITTSFSINMKDLNHINVVESSWDEESYMTISDSFLLLYKQDGKFYQTKISFKDWQDNVLKLIKLESDLNLEISEIDIYKNIAPNCYTISININYDFRTLKQKIEDYFGKIKSTITKIFSIRRDLC